LDGPRRSQVVRLAVDTGSDQTLIVPEALDDIGLRAYQLRCAVCRLRHEELLDAAHILPDGHPRGEPIIPNGLSLCKLHHAAFDRYILGVRPDLTIEIRRDVLEEEDGPMLEHGLQEIAGRKLIVPIAPRQRPNEEFLEEALFKRAG